MRVLISDVSMFWPKSPEYFTHSNGRSRRRPRRTRTHAKDSSMVGRIWMESEKFVRHDTDLLSKSFEYFDGKVRVTDLQVVLRISIE